MTRKPELLGALAALSILVMLYSLIIAQQILLGLLIVVFIWLFYMLYRILLRMGRLASALERLVDQRIEQNEREESERGP